MRRFDEIEQGTKEWHELRYAKVGGSTSKGLQVKSDTLKITLMSEMLEDFVYVPERFISADIERGNLLEPIALEELNKYTGLTFGSTGWIQCEDNYLLGISPDGITDDNKISCEIKCPGKKKHMETVISGSIPLDHIHQCLHYFVVNPTLEKHYFASFRPENRICPLFVTTLTRDSEINVGTIKKPVLKTVSEMVEVTKKAAYELQLSIQESINALRF